MGDALAQGTLYVGDLLPVAGKPMPKLGADADNVDRSTAESPFIPAAATTEAVATEDPGDGSTITSAEYAGLAAFLLDNCVDGGDGTALSAANAIILADEMLAEMRTNGGAFTTAAIDALIAAGAGDTGITVAATIALNVDFEAGLLQVLAGQVYTVAAESEVAAIGGAKSAAAGAFTTASQRAQSNVTTSMALTESLANGQLSVFTAATFSYSGTDAAAFVVYGDDGSIL